MQMEESIVRFIEGEGRGKLYEQHETAMKEAFFYYLMAMALSGFRYPPVPDSGETSIGSALAMLVLLSAQSY